MNRHLICGTILLLVAGCGRASQTADVPDAVFVPPNARELRVANGPSPGQIDVTYAVDERFPAPETRRGLGQSLQDSGYKALDHDFLEPVRTLEAPREWRSYGVKEGGCVQEFVEDWQNAAGDIARAGLRYEAPCATAPERRSEPTSTTLKVIVAMIPAATAEAMRQAVREAGGTLDR